MTLPAIERYWYNVGKKTLEQLPKQEWQPFTDWLEHNQRMLELYEKSPGEALRMWHDSIERYQIAQAS